MTPAVTGAAMRGRRGLVGLAQPLAALLLLAHPAAAQVDPSAILQGLRVDRSRLIDFRAARFPDTVYVGEQVTYQVAVLLSEEARARLRRNPEFVPPELRGMLAYELGRPARRDAVADGVPYEAFVFQRALFPVAVGTLVIPAPALTYALPQSSSFFSREVRESVRAESLTVVVRPLPVEGRPAAYDGAVGRMRASARLDTAGLRVGIPSVLTVRIEGTGNLRLAPRPRVEVPWGSVVPGTERVTLDTAGPLVRGTKEFEWILTPAKAGADSLPALAYPYFDPGRGVYDEARTAPIPVTVAPGAAVVVDGEGSTALEPLRAWDREAPVPWAVRLERRLPWLGAGLAGVPMTAALALLVAARRRRRARQVAQADPPPAVPPSAVAAEPPTAAGEARRRRRHLMDAIAARIGGTAESMAGREAFTRALRRQGVSREVTDLALALRDQLEAEGFGPAGVARGPSAAAGAADEAVRAVLERIDEEAIPRMASAGTPRRGRRTRRGAVGAGGLLAAVLALVTMVLPLVLPAVAVVRGGAIAQRVPQPAGAPVAVRHVADGERAYADRHFRQAAESFARAVAARPHDVVLLANWGTAAWAAADTVSAVVAWQRAARLQPWAEDLQRNLARLPAGARTGVASVPLVPVAGAVLAGACAWVAGWVMLAWGWWPAGRAARRRLLVAGGTSLAGALVLGGWAGWGRARLSAEGLGAVRAPETLRTAPTPDAPAAGGVGTGDLVALELTRDGWARVVHADGRRGWLPWARIRPLLPAPPVE